MPSIAQHQSEVEYWFDNRVDNRQKVSITGTETVAIDAATDNLDVGLHWLYIRVVDADGVYSGITSSPFIKCDPRKGNTFEYWIDDNFDNVHTKPINVLGGETALTLLLDMGNVPIGIHRLNYRIVTMGGNINPASTAFFVKTGDGEPDRLEYWIDDDVKHSRFAEGATKTDSCIIITNELDLTDVPVGLHRLNFRLSSSNNRSLSTPSMAFIMVGGATEPLMEFWLDDDIDNTKTMAMTRYGSSYVADGLLDLSDVENGLHRLNYRFTTTDKRSSSATGTSIVVISSIPDFYTQSEETKIVKGVYWVDDQEPVAFADFEPGMEVNIEELVNLASLEDGEHVLSMRFMASNGRWTDIDHTIFYKSVLENTICIAGIIYEQHSNQGNPYVTVIGYEDDIAEIKVLPKVTFGNKELVVTNIDPKAFYGCNTVDDIALLPSTMTNIGDESFAMTSVHEVRLGAVAAPVIGNDAFPSGTNLRVPVEGTGYGALSSLFEHNNIRLTYDYECIYDDQWAALKRIDKMVSGQGGNTGWDFTDRKATPAGIERWGDDNVCEIDLSYHNLTGSYNSGDWTDGLPKISRINLVGNSILDMRGYENYHIMRLDSQQYNLVTETRVSDLNVEQLLEPDIPLIFRDANTGELGNPSNHHITYSLKTMTSDSIYVSENQENYGILLDVAPFGEISSSQNNNNASNVYHGKSGDLLFVTSAGNQSLTPNSYYKTHLYFDDGDVNINGEVDVADLQHVINHIFDFGEQKNIFAWHAANLAKDDIINVQDVVGVVGVILDQVPESANANINRLNAMADGENEIDDATLILTDEALILQSDHDVAALDLVVNDEIDLSAIKNLGMTISSKTMTDGRVHIVVYSLSGRVVPAGEHIIATNTVGKNLSSAKLVDLEANRLSTIIMNMASGVTDIEEINNGNSVDGHLYDVSGRRVSKTYRGVVIQNGKTRVSNSSK